MYVEVGKRFFYAEDFCYLFVLQALERCFGMREGSLELDYSLGPVESNEAKVLAI